MLKQNPCATDLLTNWSGRLSNPTWPPSSRCRFSSFWGIFKQAEHKYFRTTWISAVFCHICYKSLNIQRIHPIHPIVGSHPHIQLSSLRAFFANEVTSLFHLSHALVRPIKTFGLFIAKQIPPATTRKCSKKTKSLEFHLSGAALMSYFWHYVSRDCKKLSRLSSTAMC